MVSSFVSHDLVTVFHLIRRLTGVVDLLVSAFGLDGVYTPGNRDYEPADIFHQQRSSA